MIDPAILRRLLRYDPETGRLFWREREKELFNGRQTDRAKAWNAQFAGQEAFTAIDSEGYCSGRIFNRTHRAHRVIWAMQTGAWPDNDVDHRDGDRANNRWCNLREATRSQNLANVGLTSANTSGFKGVSLCRSTGKWRAQISVDGVTRSIGRFATKGEAASAYGAEERRLRGDFARQAEDGECMA